MKRLSLFLLLFPIAVVARPDDVTFFQQEQVLCIIENKGQIKDQYGKYRLDIDFAIHGDGINVFISSSALSYQFFKEDAEKQEMCRVDVQLVGADNHALVTVGKMLPYYEHYYHPDFGTDGAVAHSYEKITYKNVYPNIDKVLYIKNGKAEYDFVIRQGGKVEDIEINYKGAKDITLNEDGSLLLGTPMGTVRETAPICYNANGGKIQSNYKLENGSLRFEVEKHNGEFTIDPTLTWSTYYGGSGQEMGASYVCYDPAGYVYLAASTKSTNNIATVGSYQETRSQIGNNNAINAFIVKFDTNGIRQWATYYSGELNSSVFNIVIDVLGDLYICGSTDCTTGMATAGTYQTSKASGTAGDAFLAKFTGAGNRVWSTYYGGGGVDAAYGLCLDGQGHVFIAGYTQSEDSIATIGAHQTIYGNPGLQNAYDGFVAKFDTTGNIVWGTYYGGDKMDRCSAVRCDSGGYVYACGATKSTTAIATTGSHQPAFMFPANNENNAFLVKFNSNGVRQWATYYGDTGGAIGANIACTQNDIYMVGSAGNAADISTPGTFQFLFGGGIGNGYIAKFDSNGIRQWGTYFGSNGRDHLNNIILDNTGHLYISGAVEGDSLATSCSFQDTCLYCDLTVNDRTNGLFGIFDNSGQRIYSTYYGRGATNFNSLCMSANTVYLGGATSSATNISTVGIQQQTYGGGSFDCILTKFDLCTIPTQPLLTGDTIICPGTDPFYAVDLSVSCDGADFTWALPTGWTGSSTGSTISVVANSNSGTITVTPYNVCGMAGPPASLYVAVLPVVPTPVITQNGNILSTGTYDFYQWLLNGNPVSGATSQSYIATQGGTYTVQVWDTGSCDVTSAGITLSAGNTTMKNSVVIYPNPTRGTFTIEAKEAGIAIMQDVSGRQLATYDLNKGKTTIILPDIASGIYLLQYRSKSETVNLKLIKE